MRSRSGALFAVCLVAMTGCRKSAPSKIDPVIVEVPDTNQPFTPPEIRRSLDSSDRGDRNDAVPAPDTAALPVAPIATPAPAKPPAPAAAVAAPTPAPPPTAPPTPASVPTAVPAPAAKPVATATGIPAGTVLPGETGEWTIQVGIHKSEEGARTMIAKLNGKGIRAYVVQAAAGAGLSGSYWRVRVGCFAARSDAQAFGDKVLKPGGYSFWIDRKSNEAASAGGNP